jgi:hypothetical protein
LAQYGTIHHSRPSAMTCCWVCSFKTLLTSTQGTRLHACVNVLRRGCSPGYGPAIIVGDLIQKPCVQSCALDSSLVTVSLPMFG